MNTEELKRHIDESGETAFEVLSEKLPQANRRFDRLAQGLNALLEDVRREFPDANYYSANGTLNLMLTETHDRNGRAQNFGSAIAAARPEIGGGDW
ncbi:MULTISPECIES: hypothetical protein [Serratia]|uniref:hypothetical protein n=1 Tax=Serratia TaxID=613 RepID=UPI0018E8B95B|nr:hypothetical protein [Serratia ureilytica]MBJ2093857.1 hypothetical protein [Serratia ureilytica]